MVEHYFRSYITLFLAILTTPIINSSLSVIFESSYLVDYKIPFDSIESLTARILTRYSKNDCLLSFASAAYQQNHIFHSGTHTVVSLNEFNHNKHNETRYVQEILIPSMELGCTGHILQNEDSQAQLSLITRTYVKADTNYLYDVFRSSAIRHVTNLVVVIPTEENELVLYTHRFSGPGDLFQQKVLLDVYSPVTDTFRSNADLFPDKIKDLAGRDFTVSVLEYPPYVATDRQTGELFGTEWNVVIEYCKRHNCTLRPLIDNVYLFGEIFDNATGNGVLGNVVEDKADVGFGSIDLWYHEWLFLDLGPAFVRTAVTCLVPPPRPLPQWTTPILPFDEFLWCAVIAAVILDAIVIYIVYAVANWIRQASSAFTKDGQSFMTPITACLTSIGLSVEQSLSSDVHGGSRRVLILALLLVSLLISTSYGSGLSSVLTVPRFEKPIDTIEELEASGITWSAPHEAWIFSLYGSNETWLLNLIDHFMVLPPNLTTVKAYELEMGFCVERLPGGNYAIQDYLPAKAVENLHLMSGDIYWTYTVSMLRKSSPFTESYTALELELLASGIPSYWEGICVMLSLDTITQYAVPDVELGVQPVQLNVAQIQGAFLFLCCGLAAAMVMFVYEVAPRPTSQH